MSRVVTFDPAALTARTLSSDHERGCPPSNPRLAGLAASSTITEQGAMDCPVPGPPCPRCGHAIRQTRLAGRGTLD